MAVATQAAFKIPSLRNVELTGPYMHNGGMATLSQVIQAYARHGNFISPTLHFHLNAVQASISSAQNTMDLTNFLLSLTDERVRYQRAPFDHPQITVKHGQAGNELQVTAGNQLSPNLAQDQLLVIPAVGASGSATPVSAFLSSVP